jgi:hypothetical protein
MDRSKVDDSKASDENDDGIVVLGHVFRLW